VTTNSDLDQIVDQYLHRLEAALADLPAQRREQLIESITDHISEARATLSADSEVAVRDILDRVGQPADIAAEALADQTMSSPLRASSTRRKVVAAVVIIFIVFLVFGTFLTTRINNGAPSTSVNVTTTTTLSITVPNVVGMSLNAAEAQLAADHFAYVVVFACTGSGVQSGDVEAQTPSPGSSVAEGTSVRLITPPKSCH
jgi:uncharacterized membrane protein YgcG